MAKGQAEPIEALLPDVPVGHGPFGHVLERLRLDPARSPLRLAAAHDQPGPLQHAQVLGHGRHAHVEGLRQLGDRALAHRQPGENRAAGRVGERGKRGAQLIHRHLY